MDGFDYVHGSQGGIPDQALEQQNAPYEVPEELNTGDAIETEAGMGDNEKMTIAKTAVTGASGIAESMMNMFSNARDRRAQEEIDAAYDEQEELNRIERDRQKGLAREQQKRQDRLEDLQRSYIQRGRIFQDRLDAELEKYQSAEEAKNRMKGRLKTSDGISELRQKMRRGE